MDGGPASISMLRAAVDTVEGRVPVVLDSGIRRGIDVFRALALGATAVGIGRPALWGLINGGSLGVKSVYGAARLRAALDDAAFGRREGHRPQARESGEGLAAIDHQRRRGRSSAFFMKAGGRSSSTTSASGLKILK